MFFRDLDESDPHQIETISHVVLADNHIALGVAELGEFRLLEQANDRRKFLEIEASFLSGYSPHILHNSAKTTYWQNY